MTYALAAPLQAAVFAALQESPAVASIAQGRIYDALPRGPVPELFVLLGEEQVRDGGDYTAQAAIHTLTVSVISSNTGFSSAKMLAGAVSTALTQSDLTVPGGVVVSLRFDRAKPRRVGRDQTRRIDMTFRPRLDADPNT